MPRPVPSFPAVDVWQNMSEAEQNALLTRMERARRRSDVLFGVLLVALFVVGAMSGLFYVAAGAPVWPW